MNLTQKQWLQEQEQYDVPIILDVRTANEYAEGHIENAQLLDINDPPAFMAGLEKLDVTKAYFVYCRSGARSARACQIMAQMGFSTAYNLLGGILEWEGTVV